MKGILSKALPNPIKKTLTSSKFYISLKAKNLANTSKRLDVCAAQLSHNLLLCRHASLENKTCMEIGSGWVLSHALVCYLLGAKRVIATDIFPCAQPKALQTAIGGMVTSIPRDLLAPFSKHELVRDRIDQLQKIKNFNFNELEKIGIEYRSPIDLSKESIGESVDFIYSNSVLEHVPKGAVRSLLANLNEHLNAGGTMLHAIHLEDHKSIKHHPFEFLKEVKDYSIQHETDRGNRIRSSEWLDIFQQLPNSEYQTIYSHSRVDTPLPETIDPTIAHTGEQDLRISHLGILTKSTR